MPLYCPRFSNASADGSQTCLRCGAAFPPSDPKPIPASVTRRFFEEPDPFLAPPARRDAWKMPALASGVLLASVGLALLFAPPSPPHIAPPSRTVQKAPSPAPPPQAAPGREARLLAAAPPVVRVSDSLSLAPRRRRHTGRLWRRSRLAADQPAPRPRKHSHLIALRPRTGPPAALPSPVFCVVAARLPSPKNAAVLAAALQDLGFHPIVRQIASRQGKTSYAVETGAYPEEYEAHNESLALQRSGYPAYYISDK